MDDVPDPQVPERARRRTYTARYKRDVLDEYEAADRAGKGALLRREGLYTSLISAWRDQRDTGAASNGWVHSECCPGRVGAGTDCTGWLGRPGRPGRTNAGRAGRTAGDGRAEG